MKKKGYYEYENGIYPLKLWVHIGKLVALLLFNQAILVLFARSLILILVRMDLSRNVVYERFTQKNMVISVLSFITTHQRLWLLEHFI